MGAHAFRTIALAGAALAACSPSTGPRLPSTDAASDTPSSPYGDARPEAAPGASGAATSIAFGPGLVATLSSGGALTVSRAGSTLLATPPGAPLFSSATDPVSPAGYHDPKALSADTFTALDAAAVTIDSPAPGLVHLAVTDARPDVVLVSLALASDAGFYTGLGERYDHVDPRGGIVGMQLEVDPRYESSTTDRHVPVPWLVSSRGYGVFVKSRQAGAFDVASADPAVVRATFEGASLDVTLVVDPDPLRVVAKLTQLTGLQRATPTWALAPMMWRHVDDQAQLLADLAHIRALHIPTTTYWIDDGWQTALDTLAFDPAKYPDVARLGGEASALGFTLLGWNSPYLHAPAAGGTPDDAQALYPAAAANGDFVEQGGAPFVTPGPGGGGYGLLDFTRPSATAFWASRASVPVGLGLVGFKLDYGEDMVPSLFGSRLGLTLADGESERTARTYPLGYHGAYRQALNAGEGTSAPGGGILIVRASTYGGAQVADIVWPGDLDNGFQRYGDPSSGGSTSLVGGLPASVVAAQTLAASGFALYGADTGGYRMGAPTKESLLRWAEHTALSMVMQLGPGETKYPWNYDADTVATYTSLAALHQRLVPYLATLLAAAQNDGTPPIRPLPLAYPDDPDAPARADDEYLLGPSLLVAPVVTEGVTSRDVHLPPGVWFPYWGGPAVTGPATLPVQAPLGQPPLFVLAGSLLPLLPDGVDTLVASNDPSTVSLDAKAGLDLAAGWVRGDAAETFLDGSSLSVTDDAAGVEVTWSPAGSGRALTVTLDLSQRSGGASPLIHITTVYGTTPTIESTAANVATSPVPASYLAGGQAVLRLDGPTKVVLSP